MVTDHCKTHDADEMETVCSGPMGYCVMWDGEDEDCVIVDPAAEYEAQQEKGRTEV